MEKFWKCFWYLIETGILSFFVGRMLPKNRFSAERFPYAPFDFEQDGKIYEKLGIRYWQNKVPDMSKILPKWIPAKNLSGNIKHRLPRMLQETCVAECIHVLLCISGLYCLKLYPGVGGFAVWLVYAALFNLPYIIIQRYNRPRLAKLARKMGVSGSEALRGDVKTV